MSFSRTAAIVLRQFYLMRGSAARVLPLFAWVAIDIILWGFMSKYLNTISAPRLNFVPSLLGAVLLWDFLGRVMFGVTTAFLEDVWSRNFLNFFASPMTVADYVSGLVLSSILTSCYRACRHDATRERCLRFVNVQLWIRTGSVHPCAVSVWHRNGDFCNRPRAAPRTCG